jgi:hypothetical protein
MLTLGGLSGWQRLNFGAGLLAAPVEIPGLLAAIDAYDPADAAGVTDRLRAEASMDACVDRYLALYAAALADPTPVDHAARAAATAAWIEDLTPSIATGDWHRIAAELFAFAADPPAAALQGMEARLSERLQAANQPLERGLEGVRTEIGAIEARVADAEAALREQMFAVGAALEAGLAEANAATAASIAGLMSATEELRLVLEQPTLTRLLWRRLTPVPLRQMLHRMLSGR